MITYKITNITDSFGKRDFNYKTNVNIVYIDERRKKTISLGTGESIYLTVASLPTTINRLRIKKLISISEVSPTELKSIMNQTKPPLAESPTPKKTTTKPKEIEVKKVEDKVEKKVIEKSIDVETKKTTIDKK